MLNVNFIASVACVLNILKSKLVHNAWCANIYMHWTFHPFNSTPKMLTSFLGENCLRERELCDRKQFQFQSRRSWLPDKTGSLWQTSLSGSFPKQKNSAMFLANQPKPGKGKKGGVKTGVMQSIFCNLGISFIVRSSREPFHHPTFWLQNFSGNHHHHFLRLAIKGNKTKPVDLIRQD